MNRPVFTSRLTLFVFLSARHCPHCRAWDSSWWWPRSEALPVHYREGLGCGLQGPVWPPCLPRGYPAQAQHGHCRTLLLPQIQQPGDRNGHCHCPAPHRASCSPWWGGCVQSCKLFRHNCVCVTCLVSNQMLRWRCYVFPVKALLSCLEVRVRRKPPSTWTPWTSVLCTGLGPWPSHMVVPCRLLPLNPGVERKRMERRVRKSSSRGLWYV